MYKDTEMSKENGFYTYNGIWISHKEEWKMTCSGTGKKVEMMVAKMSLLGGI